MKLESEWYDENLSYCPICGYAFENHDDYIQHRKSGCTDYGVLALIKSKCKLNERK